MQEKKQQQVIIEKERGQGMVEFAFSLVLLLTLLVGIVDLSRALFTYMAIRDAAEEGALVASIQPDDLDKVRERVVNSSSLVAGLGLSTDPDVDIVITFNNFGEPAPCQGSLVTVWVEYPDFQLTMPFIGAILGTQVLAIRAQVSATVLYPAC